MIPKIIHFCWFGGTPKTQFVKDCIDSWEKYCPDYKIVEWNENNFDINSNKYVKQAYLAKKWAFVSDYVRLHALYNYGGLYMDADLEVIKNLDKFLSHKAFSGFEDDCHIPTAIMGAEPEHDWIYELLKEYDTKLFIKDDGTYDMVTNVTTITNATFNAYNLELNNSYQVLKHGLTIYPKDWFCPKSHETGETTITNNTHTIHHFNGSWHTQEMINAKKIRVFFGGKIGMYLGVLYLSLKTRGLIKTLKKLKKVFLNENSINWRKILK